MSDDFHDKSVCRRSVFGLLLGGFVAAATTITLPGVAEAKPGKGRGWGRGGRRGNPPGWSRGRKRGWAKRGGPKWGW